MLGAYLLSVQQRFLGTYQSISCSTKSCGKISHLLSAFLDGESYRDISLTWKRNGIFRKTLNTIKTLNPQTGTPPAVGGW